jgi:hypothetical protein
MPRTKKHEGLKAVLALQRVPLLCERAVQVAGQHDHAKEQHALVDEACQSAREARRPEGWPAECAHPRNRPNRMRRPASPQEEGGDARALPRVRRRPGQEPERALRRAASPRPPPAALEWAATSSGRRNRGSRRSWAARPGCAWGVDGRETRVVEAPGLAWTIVGLTGRVDGPGPGAGTTFCLATGPAPGRASWRATGALAVGADAAACAASARRSSVGSAW